MKTIRLFTLCLLACALQAMADNKPTVVVAGEPVEGSLVRITFEADNAILEFSDADAIETDMADVDISFVYEPAPIPTGLTNEDLRMKNQWSTPTGKTNEEWQGALYDLQGRLVCRGYEGTKVRGYEISNKVHDSNLAPSHPRTSAPSIRKGIYIQNGRKIIIK